MKLETSRSWRLSYLLSQTSENWKIPARVSESELTFVLDTRDCSNSIIQVLHELQLLFLVMG